MEPSIKGSLLAVGLAQLFQLVERGKIDLREVEAALGREWFDAARAGRIAPSAWYPVDFYDRVLVLMMNRAGDGRSEYLVELGRQGAAALASQGIYKQLERTAGDEADERFVRQLLTLAKALYSFTTWELESFAAESGSFVIKISGADRYPESLRWRNCGFLEAMTAHAVGRAVTLTSERQPADTIRFRIQCARPAELVAGVRASYVVALKSICAVACAVALLSSPHTARADDPDFGRSGAYIGVGASRSSNLVEAFLDGTPVLEDIDVSNSWGVNARLGYRLTSWFALEAEYEWLDAFNASLYGVHVGTLEFQSATANLRLIAPFWRFQPYFLLGAGVLFSKVDTPFNQIQVDHSAFAGRVGLGLDVYLTQNLLLNVGAEGILSPAEVRLNTGTTNVSEHGLGTVTFQAGLGWRF